MRAFTIMLLGLCIFECMAWLSPAKTVFNRLSNKFFYTLNPYYIPRILILLAVVTLMKPRIPPPFTSSGWAISALLGLTLCMVNILMNPGLGGLLRKGKLPSRLKEIISPDPKRFWMITAYMLICTGLIEELIFRWFFTASLQPHMGWWTLAVSTLICTLWHYPVIFSEPRMYTGQDRIRWSGLLAWSTQAYIFGFLLTVISITTHDIAGAVLAHGFTNWSVLLSGGFPENDQTGPIPTGATAQP